jgi:PAS domain S-box-containing protein
MGQGLEAIFGYQPEEVIGRRLDFLIPPVLREKHWEGFYKAVATGRMKGHGARRA